MYRNTPERLTRAVIKTSHLKKTPRQAVVIRLSPPPPTLGYAQEQVRQQNFYFDIFGTRVRNTRRIEIIILCFGPSADVFNPANGPPYITTGALTYLCICGARRTVNRARRFREPHQPKVYFLPFPVPRFPSPPPRAREPKLLGLFSQKNPIKYNNYRSYPGDVDGAAERVGGCTGRGVRGGRRGRRGGQREPIGRRV